MIFENAGFDQLLLFNYHQVYCAATSSLSSREGFVCFVFVLKEMWMFGPDDDPDVQNF